MPVFLPQARAETPRNALLDFSPIHEAIDSNRRHALAQGQQDLQRQEVDMSRQRLGMQQREFDEKQKQQITQRFGALSQVIDTEQDPAKRAAMWRRVIGMHPNAKGLDPAYHDPMQGPKLLMAESGHFQDPLDRQYKQAQIADLGRRASATSTEDARAAAAIKYGLTPGTPAFQNYVLNLPRANEPGAPSGYRYTDSGDLRPIPGGPADKITGEQAARVALLMNAKQNLPTISKIFLGTTPDGSDSKLQAVSPGSAYSYYTDSGDIGEAKRLMYTGMEGVLRALTGAAATKEEVERELMKYMPTPLDTFETRKRKLALFEQTVNGVLNVATHGLSGSDIRRDAGTHPTGQQSSPQAPPQPQASAGPETGQRQLFHNPQTGEVIQWDGEHWVRVK